MVNHNAKVVVSSQVQPVSMTVNADNAGEGKEVGISVIKAGDVTTDITDSVHGQWLYCQMQATEK